MTPADVREGFQRPAGAALVLAVGQSVELPSGGALALVKLEDERCPRGAVCAQAGAVRATLTLTPEASGAEAATVVLGGELGAPLQAPPAIDTLGYRLGLLRVDPYPALGETTGRPRRVAPSRVVVAVGRLGLPGG